MHMHCHAHALSQKPQKRFPLEGSYSRKVPVKQLFRLCPTDCLFAGSSVINTLPSSKFLKREPSKGPEAQKTKPLLRASGRVWIRPSISIFSKASKVSGSQNP